MHKLELYKEVHRMNDLYMEMHKEVYKLESHLGIHKSCRLLWWMRSLLWCAFEFSHMIHEKGILRLYQSMREDALTFLFPFHTMNVMHGLLKCDGI